MAAEYYFIYVRDWVEFAIATMSLICSFLTLVIIKKMKIWNGNLLLITTLTMLQICYDINFMFGICPGYIPCVIWHFLDVFGGLGVQFTTNVMSFIIVYIVTEIESVNILKNYKYFSIYMIIIPFIFGFLSMFSLQQANADDDKPYTECVYQDTILADIVENFYYWARLVCIVFNMIAFGFVSYRVNQLGFDQNKNHGRSTETGLTAFERKSHAVKALASRMKYYPFVQAITRCGSAWNEFQNYEYSNNVSTIMSAVCSSFSGTAYFLVFLVRDVLFYVWLHFLIFLFDSVLRCFSCVSVIH
jgi:hypothetical protein